MGLWRAPLPTRPPPFSLGTKPLHPRPLRYTQVAALAKQEFNLVEADLPNGLRSAAHLALSDAAGDSAIVEVLNEGAAVNIYHNETYLVRNLCY